VTHPDAVTPHTQPPVREAYSRAARRFALSTELRGLRTQLALLNRTTSQLLKLQKDLVHLQERLLASAISSRKSHPPLSFQKVSTALSKLVLLLFDGKASVVGPLQQLINEAQLLVDTKLLGNPLFPQTLKVALVLPIIVEVLAKLKSATTLATATQASVTSRFDTLQQGRQKTRRTVTTPEGDRVEELSHSKKKMKDFLESMQDRGWKVSKPKVPEPPVVEVPRYNPVTLLNEVTCPSVCLLDPSVEMGLVKVPLLVAIVNSLTVNSLINAIKESELDYQVHHCYSKYYVIERALSMGIQRSMMNVYTARPSSLGFGTTSRAVLNFDQFLKKVAAKELSDKALRRKKKHIDSAKFRALLPFLQQENVLYSDLIPKLSIANTPYRVGNHYYCPLLPKTLVKDLEFIIESWSFLVHKENPNPSGEKTKSHDKSSKARTA